MGVRLDTANGMPDAIKWFVAVVLLAGALGAFYFYADESLLLRVLGLLAIVAVVALIVLQTERGRLAWGFVLDARNEVRKVVWPTRKETIQTTGIVVAMVALVALILWGLDSFLGYAVRLVLSQGG